jgi:hypothetical protein
VTRILSSSQGWAVDAMEKHWSHVKAGHLDKIPELARLFADAGASGVNIEDVRIDHDPGRPTGLVELLVAPDMEEHLLTSLESRGWVTHR